MQDWKTEETHLEDLEAGNIQHTDEVLSWFLRVQGFVHTGHKPAEHTGVQSFSQGRHSELHLGHGLALGYPLRADFHFGCEESLQQISAVDAEQMGHLYRKKQTQWTLCAKGGGGPKGPWGSKAWQFVSKLLLQNLSKNALSGVTLAIRPGPKFRVRVFACAPLGRACLSGKN